MIAAYRSPAPTLGFLRKAAVCAKLSARVYGPFQGQTGAAEAMALPALPTCAALPGLPEAVQALLVDTQAASACHDPLAATQYGIWYVDGAGYICAFRGTQSAADWTINLQTTTIPLKGRLAARKLELHAGFYRRALSVANQILKAVKQHAADSQQMLPLTLTGK